MLAAKTDSRCTYLVLGIENQSNVHYAMPVRNMIYDALQYDKQVRDLAVKHRKRHDAVAADEYLSGLRKDDRIVPVITLVINFGSRRLDGPLSLREMFNDQPEELLPFIQDYRIFLIDPMAMANEDFQRFQSSLREVLAFLKHQKDTDEMQRLVNENERYKYLERNAAMVMRTMTNTEFFIDEDTEMIDVCEAIRGMMQNARMEGIQEGIQEDRREMALRMLCLGASVEFMEKVTQLSREEILLLEQNNTSHH